MCFYVFVVDVDCVVGYCYVCVVECDDLVGGLVYWIVVVDCMCVDVDCW